MLVVWRWDVRKGAGKASKLSDLVLGRIAWPFSEIEETERCTLGKNATVDVAACPKFEHLGRTYGAETQDGHDDH